MLLIVLDSQKDGNSPLDGKAGLQFRSLLRRGGFSADQFEVTYVNAAPEQTVPEPDLDAVCARVRPRCVLAGGVAAHARMLPGCPVGLYDARGYVWRDEERGLWVVPTLAPASLVKGQTNQTIVFLHDLARALEIEQNDFEYLDTNFYSLDPTPAEALEWNKRFDSNVSHLSCDIETPDKDRSEDELEDTEAEEIKDRSYTILRCGYSYHDADGNPHVMSIPWGGPYEQVHKALLESDIDKLWWNKSFDVPRIAAAGITVGGTQHDGMESWHVLNSDLRRSLGFVSVFFNPRLGAWKHTSDAAPARYNAQDAYAADCNQLAIVKELKKHNLWDVYQQQVLDMDPIFTYMSAAGMPVDAEKRLESAKYLTELLDDLKSRMHAVVPREVCRVSPPEGYKTVPKDTTGLEQRTFDAQTVVRCGRCGLVNPRKNHFQSYVRKVNPCAGAEKVTSQEGVVRWVKVLLFSPSPKQILRYQEVVGHKPILDRMTKRPTTDAKALVKLRAKYVSDPLYPMILDFRKADKLAGTYIGRYEDGKVVGGFKVGKDGLVHAQFTNAPSTLRTSMRSPNLQNLPR
jgi:uncharacterized C2H2 Zn-finger protein